MEKGWIGKAEACFLFAISNHPSPMFLLGYVMNQLGSVLGLPGKVPSWQILVSLYLPILPIAALANRIYRRNEEEFLSDCPKEWESSPDVLSFSLDDAFLSCAETMVKIGGYIMLFSILSLYTAKLSFLSPAVRCGLLGTLEITTGIQTIAHDMTGLPALLLITASAAFGGISGIFQTKSVICTKKNAGLSIRHYVLWKLLHGTASMITMALLQLTLS